MADILIININWRKLAKIGRLRKFNPLISQELMYIESDMKRNKMNSKFIDLWGKNKDLGDIVEEIKKAKILVFCSAPSYHFWQDGTVNEDLPKLKSIEIKKINPDIKIIIVGPHGSILPETFFNSKIEYIIRGEPDLITTKLVNLILKRKKINLDCVCYKKNGSWIVGDKSAVVEDMTKLPILRYDQLNPADYSWPTPPEGHNFKRVSVFEASRGCTFNCVFCFRKGFRGKYRQKNIEQIKQELDLMKKQGIEYFFIIDEIFGVNNEWATKVCKEIGKREFKWGCESRPEYLSNELIQTFADNGCLEVRFGLESANKEVLKKIGKGSTNLGKLKDYVSLMVEKGINTKFFCIAGLPGSNKKTIKQTLEYVLKFDLLRVNAATNIMVPYPGTTVWNMALSEGKKLNDWNDLDKYAGTIANDFKKPSEVMKQVAIFNATILQKKSKLKIINNMKKGFRNPCFILKSIAAYFGCIVIRRFPSTYPFFARWYRFLVT